MPEEKLLIETAVPECGYHTYKTKEIGSIGYWSNWLGIWNKAETIQEMLGLLHCGFSVSLGRASYNGKEYSEADRLKFYFTVAEGWSDASILRLTRDESSCFLGYGPSGRIVKSQSELWQTLAQKAFDMLALNLFGQMPNVRIDNHGYRWLELLSANLFPAIKSFFRVNEKGDMVNGFYRPFSEKTPHGWEICVKFLLDLTRFLWSWQPGYWAGPSQKDYYSKAPIEEAKVLMVEDLAFLRRLDVLEEWLPLDEVCVAKLKEIAMRAELSYGNKVKTIDEACMIGSKAAWLVKKCELVLREQLRLKELREAEKAAEEAANRLKNLMSGK